MKIQRYLGQISQRTNVLFLGVAVLSVFSLIWMGLRLLKQDRILELQQLEAKKEKVADRIVASLEQILVNEDRNMETLQKNGSSLESDDYFFVVMDSHEALIYPENRLLYYPFLPSEPETSPSIFEDAERAEFQNRDNNRALALLRPLSNSKNMSTRTGAKFRMARILRKTGCLSEALKIYRELRNLPPESQITISGVPIGLRIRPALFALLSELGQIDQMKQGSY